MKIKALVADKTGDKFSCEVKSLTTDQLSEGDVLVKVLYSGINYKDALGCTNKGAIFKKFPIVPGIDFSGEVIESSDPRFKYGDKVLMNGKNTGEIFDGGYSEIARTHADSLVPLPEGLSLEESMILGTAGFTAALCLYRMELNGQTPAKGPILVTGASGGVGSFAVSIFSRKGYDVIAVTGKKSQYSDTLRKLGAYEIVDFNELKLGNRPLETVRFGGVIDNIGGETLARLAAHVQLWGNIACVGLAESPNVPLSVMPLILRGVSLLGVSSNNSDPQVRSHLWQRLGDDLKPNLKIIHTRTVNLEAIVDASNDLLDRKVAGRILVKI